MESVYLITTFDSYLVARPSRDLRIAGHQQSTEEWWTTRQSLFDCFISQVVIDEASASNATEIGKRLSVVAGLSALEVSTDAESLTQAIMSGGMLPPHAIRDAAHVAVATVHRIDYLLTRNCEHLANAQISRRIAIVCRQRGHRMPVICTPEELMGA